MTRYDGATAAELAPASRRRRAVALADQRRVLSHHGTLELTPEQLVLNGWRQLAPGDVVAVEQTFDQLYSRRLGAGVRGGFGSLGVLARLGAPIRLTLADGERLYLLVNFRWLLGVTDNREWCRRLRAWQAGVAR